jgi:hypothetical protein
MVEQLCVVLEHGGGAGDSPASLDQPQGSDVCPVQVLLVVMPEMYNRLVDSSNYIRL